MAARKPAPDGEAKKEVALAAGVLAKAMKGAAAIVASSVTIPILANARLIADGGTIEITTSDLDTEYRQTVPLTGAGRLAVTVDAKRLAALAGAVDASTEMKLAMDGGRLTVKAGRSRWVLPVMPAEDFPAMPHGEMPGMEIAGADLARHLGRVLPAAGTDPGRPWMCGACLHEKDGRAALTATQRHILIHSPMTADWPAGAPEIILPTKLARTIESAAGEFAGRVTVAWDERKLRAVIGDVTITGKLVQDNFPDWQRAVPEECEPVVLEPEAVCAAIRRTAIVADRKSEEMRVDRGDGLIVLSMSNFDAGEGTEEVPAMCAASFTTGFNRGYLATVLTAIGGDSVEIHQADAKSPALIRRAVADGALAMISPMGVK